MRAELAEARERPEDWDRFIRAHRLHRGWDSASLAQLAAAGRSIWLGMVHDGGRVAGVFCGLRLGPLLECRLPPMGSFQGFVLAHELDAAGRRAAVAAFERAAFRRLGWRCLGIAYRNLAAAEHDAVAGRVHVRLASHPCMRLENHWASVDEYFASLPGRRRADFRRRHRQVSRNPGLVVTVSSTLSPGGTDGGEASALVRANLGRHRVLRPATPPPAGYFETLGGQAGVIFVAYRERGDRLLAFDLVFDDGVDLHAAIWGSLDPHGEGQPHLYLDSHLRLISYMIERRRAGIRFGKGLTELKERFGCTATPLHTVVRPR